MTQTLVASPRNAVPLTKFCVLFWSSRCAMIMWRRWIECTYLLAVHFEEPEGVLGRGRVSRVVKIDGRWQPSRAAYPDRGLGCGTQPRGATHSRSFFDIENRTHPDALTDDVAKHIHHRDSGESPVQECTRGWRRVALIPSRRGENTGLHSCHHSSQLHPYFNPDSTE